jgi:hypothetical protein
LFSRAQISELPQNLKTLAMDKIWFSKLEILKMLPRSIETLDSGEEGGTRFRPTPDVLAALPPSLNDLGIDRELDPPVPGSVSHWLPMNLTSLVANTSTFTGQHLASLPRTLTNLMVMGIMWPAVTNSSQFPPNLTKLRSYLWRDLRCPSFRLLPPSVTALYWVIEMDSSYDPDLEILDALPPNLKTLECESPRTSLFQFPLQNWPSSLTSLTINIDHDMSTETFSNTVPKLPHTMRILTTRMEIPLSWLPRHITQLNLQETELKLALEDADHDACDASQLPRTLTSLQVKGISGILSKKSVGMLPPTLQSLSVRRIDDEQLVVEDDCFQSMTLLRTLSVTGDLPPAVLSFLPPTLRTLTMSVLHLQYEQDLAQLPRTLRHAEIYCTTTDLKDLFPFQSEIQSKSLDFLPPHLPLLTVRPKTYGGSFHIHNLRKPGS